MSRTPITRWPAQTIARFISEWNGGTSSSVLRERFGGDPSQIAGVLRRRGHVLAFRPSRNRVSGFPKNRPEDLRAKWAT